MEDTKGQLLDFLENVLEVEDARDIEFKRVHRLGKQRKSDGSRRMITARFLRYSDLQKSSGARIDLKTRSSKFTKISPRKLHDLRKLQMKKLKDAG